MLRELRSLNSSRVYLERFASDAGRSVPAGALVLDAGAGDCVYKRHFAHAVYESTDHCRGKKPYGAITYVCDLSAVPVESNTYDLVFCSQTLEHVPEPKKALAELYRVLKPGGHIWISAPLFYAEHEIPFDFYRYTQYAWRYMLESAGFEIKRMEWLEGYFGTLAYQLDTASMSLPTDPKAYGGGFVGGVCSMLAMIFRPAVRVLGIMFHCLDLRHKFTASGMCKNYAIVAHKP